MNNDNNKVDGTKLMKGKAKFNRTMTHLPLQKNKTKTIHFAEYEHAKRQDVTDI